MSSWHNKRCTRTAARRVRSTPMPGSVIFTALTAGSRRLSVS
jgi:hypothetical protein